MLLCSFNVMGNKKRATCFATLLQNELNSDFAPFTTHEKKPVLPYLLQDRFERGWQNAEHRYSTRFTAMLQIKLHVVC